MKIAVTGASGNVGTAVLRALHADDTVTDIVGISRRVPSPEAEPYAGVEWHSIDVGAATTADDAVPALTRAFEGADTVIHLAWIIFPNHDRGLLRRVNVDGTQHVLDACAAAGVKHVVVASSIGAYSSDPARKDVDGPEDTPPLRSEDFEARGIESSHYSEDKGAVEELLDAFEAAHPDISVARLRPGLIFQADAASEIQRFFLGSAVPVGLLGKGKLPVVPLPRGLRAQAVHSDDIAQAYRLAAIKRATGAFNICADDVLYPKDFAELLGTGRFLELPPVAVRAAVTAAHRAGSLPTDAGWVDMALGVPMMDTTRAKTELGWEPRRSAKDSLRELLDAMIEGTGHNSPSLWAEDETSKVLPRLDLTVEETGQVADEGLQVSGDIDAELLEDYLANHLTGARGAVERLDMMTLNYQDTPVFPQIARVAREIRADRDFLEYVARSFGFDPKPAQGAAAWVGERFGRLKPNGRVVERSPMALLLESELLRSAVAGKIGGWETLRDNASHLGIAPEVFDELIDVARGQLALITEIHDYAAATAFREDRDTFKGE
ncbi:NAD-dependent epimerase/dehydratase family protein [Corynebacterium qintianiae]|uniref:NAD-dependent epimerase/dehydratase family protein n=1 Tax=Corynebacterium qintianiae TaxID=2709392 RepID=A0A7T0KNB6_9CORY|nr:NAD-dependent epimerase/dehydratase family protein [Corynebacterium qintianiae]QPK83654.1 NAD-dependent epimerase/dehydratase family protein [Corynebacterium qintianiae]